MKKFEFIIVLVLSIAFSARFIIHAQEGEGGEGGSNSTNSSGNGNDTEATTPGINIDDPSQCPSDRLTEDEYETCCNNLNQKRRPFPECCKYPQIVVWNWQLNACVKKVQAQGKQPERCNVYPCCFEYIGVIDKTVVTKGIKPAGLKGSFLISVDNNTRWVEPVNKSVSQCYEWLKKPVPSKKKLTEYKSFWDCYESIPLYLYDVISCSYDFNYLYCPEGVWQANLEGCEYTMKYVWNCMIGGY